MTYIIEYIQHTFDRLVDKLGEDHVYIRTIVSIIDEAAGKDIPDSLAEKADQLITTICHDPVIQKLYFPINIDIEMQAEWLEHVFCGHKCAPNGRLQDVLCRSHGVVNENE